MTPDPARPVEPPEENWCAKCSMKIRRLSTGQWVHDDDDYDPFEHVHPPTPTDLTDAR